MDRRELKFRFFTDASIAHGKFMQVFPPPGAGLRIVSAAGENIAEDVGAPVTVLLPFGSDTNQVVRVRAGGFVGVVPIQVVVTPQNSPRGVFPAEINMASGNPAFADVKVAIPLNTEAVIHAWTR